MWIITSKHAARTGAQIVRQVTNFADDLGEGLVQATKVFLNDQDNKKNARSLKIAILGLPNVGKSTFINHLIGRPICAASSKIHTTRSKATAVFCSGDTQLVFLDTPGLVGRGEVKKYKLESSFQTDAQNSMEEADVIGVIQDMSNVKHRESIDTKIIDLLKLSRETSNSVLILNKIDLMKNRKLLLQIVRKLTDKDVWPNFSDVFMISALTGDGVDEVRSYFLDTAKFKNWDYDQNTYTDQAPDVLAQRIVKARILDNLPQEMPYLIQVYVDNIETLADGSMDILVNALCPTTRVARAVIGNSGLRIRKVAQEAEQELCAAFQTAVRLKIAIPIREVEGSLRKKRQSRL
ncbi:hypothetical protein QAD02_015200 [Eretmocerus hayati]|uniref:Uncharacterized protein n=1 Tax=Eretmocerus hayati TaxID=131215 RepID=A0ACC2P8K6_9HYME|nr:hypothetical protein QAD02_015200 [Eretmocerus hayati]